MNPPGTEEESASGLSDEDAAWFEGGQTGADEGASPSVVAEVAAFRRANPGEPLPDDLADRAGELLGGVGGAGASVADPRAEEENGVAPFVDLWTAYLGIDAGSEAARVHSSMFAGHIRDLETPQEDLLAGLQLLLSDDESNPFHWKKYGYPNGGAFVSDWLTCTARATATAGESYRRQKANQARVVQYQATVQAMKGRRETG